MDSFILEQPEFLIEDVVSFANWAFDLIPAKFYNKNFNLAWIPDWPSYYSWVLQSMWHFLLNQENKDRKNIFLFIQKFDDQKIFLLNYNKIFLGKKYRLWSLSKLDFSDMENIFQIEAGQNIDFEKRLELQLPFLRFFNDWNDVLPFFVWKKVEISEVIKFLRMLLRKNTDYNLFLIGNLSPSSVYEDTLTKHENYVNYILWSKKIIKNIPFNVKLFKSILDITKKKPDIANYINSNFFSWNKSGWNWYLCFVA